MMQVRRENASFVAEMEAGKKLDYIEERRKGRGEDMGENKKRRVRQKKVMEGEGSAAKEAILGSLI
jgi:hypothetical protein